MDELYFHWYLQVICDLHGRPHKQMLDPIFSLSLAYHIQLSLVVEIEPLAGETIEVHFENTGAITLMASLVIVANQNLEIHLLWLPSHVPQVLSAILRDRLDLVFFASGPRGSIDLFLYQSIFVVFITAHIRPAR